MIFFNSCKLNLQILQAQGFLLKHTTKQSYYSLIICPHEVYSQCQRNKKITYMYKHLHNKTFTNCIKWTSLKACSKNKNLNLLHTCSTRLASSVKRILYCYPSLKTVIACQAKDMSSCKIPTNIYRIFQCKID